LISVFLSRDRPKIIGRSERFICRLHFSVTSLILVVVVMFLGEGVLVGQEANQGNRALYLDPSKPIDARVDDLLGRMTLEEKASQLVNQSRAIPRLHVPEYDWRSEALHGIAGPGVATVFPEPIGIAATFDTQLTYQMAAAIGTEGRAKHNQAMRAGRRDILEGLDFWAPNINIFRDPRWGRGQETYGEDPFLTSRMAVAFVTGMQGDDPRYLRAIATPKHFAVHSGPEPSRHVRNVEVSNHDLEDTYLPAFRAAVVEGKAGSIMCAYNRVNGEPACANSFLLEHSLRGAWAFDGYVVGDCDSVDEIFSQHHFTSTIAETAALSLKRGVDNECIDSYSKATDNSDYKKYMDAVAEGLLTESDINAAVKRLLRARFRLGMFDPPEMVKYAQVSDSEIGSEAHRQLALKVAQESMVLLKNNGVLPFRSNLKRVAVVGPLAESESVLAGNYSGSSTKKTTVLEGMQKQFNSAQVTYAPGTNFLRHESIIPASAYSTDDGQPGLVSDYFPNKEFKGPPLVHRRDAYINLEPLPHDQNSLTQEAGLTDFSVRWTGFLTPIESASYRFFVTGYTNRLWLNGKLVIDDSAPEETRPDPVVRLEAGTKYSLRLESVVQDDGGSVLSWLPLISDPLTPALEQARSADVIVAVVGITSQLEGEELSVKVPGFDGGDRTNLDLPKEEEDLLEALKATRKPLVVVLMNGSALSVNWAEQNADAILESWYSGEEGGTAIAQTLAGANNPAGRLPVTFYKGIEQLPRFDDYSMKDRTYRYFKGEPLYSFGYGLSYSSFRYSNLKLSTRELHQGAPLRMDADVTNISDRDGDEVVQLYLTFPKLSGAPIHSLAGFSRVRLGRGETRHVRFSLDPRQMSTVNETGVRLTAAGEYRLSLGGGQPGTVSPSLEASFAIDYEQIWPE
jgi:beta-glucosidase